MGMSKSAACNFVPLLARVVLGAAFISAGFHKVFQTSDFPQRAIDNLERTSTDAIDGPTDEAGQLSDDQALQRGWSIQLAGFVRDQNQEQRQDDNGADGVGEDVRRLGETLQDAADDAQETLQQGAEVAGEAVQDAADDMDGDTDEPASSGPMISKRNLYGVAMMVHRGTSGSALQKYSIQLAWLAALTELVGGIFILFGFFTRLWGLGLACVMGVAFYLTSLTGAAVPGSEGLLGDGLSYIYSNYPNTFNATFNQLALFALAFGVLFTGAGAVSIDRLLFKNGDEDDVDIDLT